MKSYDNLERQNIVCGKFDRNINLNISRSSNIKERIRIGSINPKNLKYKKFIPIATDGRVILYDNKIYSVREFLSTCNMQILNKLIVLTNRERNSILDELVDFDLRISVFETKYPIFNHIKYLSDIHKNYYELNRLLGVIEKIGIKGNGLAHYISNKHLFKIERKLRFKNRLDYFFAFAHKGGYQEVFKLKEERKDRVVIAFDFNSMYVDCMLGDFVEPKSVIYDDFRGKNITVDRLYTGLYRVILKRPKDTFFRKVHPFKYNVLNKSFYFNLEENQEIELLLFKNEIEYYYKFFNEISIIEGFYSEKTIKHPLIRYAKNLYQQRLRYKNDINHILHDLCKFKLITIHSSTNQKKFKTVYFKTKDEIIRYLSSEYMILFPKNISAEDKLFLIQDYKYFNFEKVKNGYKAKTINYDANETIYSLSAQIVANSRIKMVETIEKFLRHKSVEICYSNVDSLHISILKNELDSFLSKHKSIISNKLGDLKIESISEKGYWFDVGRYWLINDDAVVHFKNILFNHKGRNTEFSNSRKLKFLYKSESFSYVKSIYANIENAFSYHKKVQTDDEIDRYNYNRYTIKEVVDLNVAGETYSKEILNSKKIKIDLFNKIATV